MVGADNNLAAKQAQLGPIMNLSFLLYFSDVSRLLFSSTSINNKVASTDNFYFKTSTLTIWKVPLLFID